MACTKPGSLVSLLRLAAILIAGISTPVWSICYLADEYQGVFMGLLPATPSSPATLAEVMVVLDGIPLWGECYRKVGSSVILREREKLQCFRCMVIFVRSNNVLQIYTEGLEKCFLDEESARRTCPTEASIASNEAKEIVLYKKPNPEIVVLQSYCPINGRFKFTYARHDGDRSCNLPTSEFSNCPYGFSLSAKFKQCSFPDQEHHYQCLGDWEGPGNQRYLALLEGKPSDPHALAAQPSYRCAMYQEDEETGQIQLALSPDSTCANAQLVNATTGYETFSLQAAIPPRWPFLVMSRECRFPEWSQGTWNHLSVEGSIITFKDHQNFKTHTIKCIGRDNKSGHDRYRVYARSQCGDELYTCIELAHRSNHILEFQMGQYPGVQYNESICDYSQFNSKSWITLGKQGVLPDTPCPISGEYTGLVPDVQGVCAKLASDCNNPDIMFYTASNCMNRSEVYDEREYKCLGQWQEEGLMFTYTERRDVNGYQCFVGSILNTHEVSIMEADVNCMRGIDLQKFGMRMTKQGDCDPGFRPMPTTRRPYVTTPTTRRYTPPPVTNPTIRRLPATTLAPHQAPPTTPTWKKATVSNHPSHTQGSAGTLRPIAALLCLWAAILTIATVQ